MTSRSATTGTWRRGILLAFGVAAGLLLAYIDSLPRWDDAGIIAAGLLLASGVPTLLGFRPPWLMALAVGLWIPIRGLLLSHDPTFLAILAFPFVGAFAGFFLRNAVFRPSDPS